MKMIFDFDIEKAIAAVTFLIQREGGEVDMFLSVKMLYLADKQALVNWGKTITGDSFYSLPKGPILSEIYNLFKGRGRQENQTMWDSHFTELVKNTIRPLREGDVGLLSEREAEVLESARRRIHEIAPWTVARWLHDTCPEWKDPHGSSIPIDPSIILRNAGKTEEEIRLIEESNESVRIAKLLLSGQ
jgi:uncharacterized phage-associated protein